MTAENQIESDINLLDFVEQYMVEEDTLPKGQQKVIKAALKLFSEKGFLGASTSDIAKEAGVAEGTIYKYFKTKQDLLFSIITPAIFKLLAPIILKDVKEISAKEDKGLKDILEALVLNRYHLIKKNQATFRVLFREIGYHPELKEALIENIADKGRAIIEKLLQDKKEVEALKDYPITLYSKFLISMLLGFLLIDSFYTNLEVDLSPEEQLKAYLDLFMFGAVKR
jgi:AcrR family transcriptional regulator